MERPGRVWDGRAGLRRRAWLRSWPYSCLCLRPDVLSSLSSPSLSPSLPFRLCVRYASRLSDDFAFVLSPLIAPSITRRATSPDSYHKSTMSLKAELETWAAALQAYDQEDFVKSLELFSQIADSPKILTNISIIYATLGEHEAAVEHFTAATELNQYLAVA